MRYEHDSTYLVHHGIKGQQWGVRRFQNEDGTLTAAGKERYYSRDEFNSDIDDFKRNKNNEICALNRSAEKLTAMANDVGKLYQKAYKQMTLSEDAERNIWEKLHKDFGNGCDDEEYFDLCVDEYVSLEIANQVPDYVKQKEKAFESRQDAYWKNVEEIAKPIVEKYRDATLYDSGIFGIKINKQKTFNEINSFYGNVLQTKGPASLARHFDYWIYNNQEYSDVFNRFSKKFNMKTYNAKYGK